MTGWRSAIAVGVFCLSIPALADDAKREKSYGGSGQTQSGQNGSQTGMGHETGRTYGGAGEMGMAGSQSYDQYASLSEPELIWVLREGNQMEVDLAKQAVSKASNSQVKDYARTLQKDHQQAISELNTFAKQQKISPKQPKQEMSANIQEINKEHTRMMKDRFKGVSGAAFDSQFLTTMADEHQAMIGKVKAVQDKYSAQPLNDVLAKQIPTLQSHLDRAQELQRTIGVGGAGEMGTESGMEHKSERSTGTMDQGRGGAGTDIDRKFDQPSSKGKKDAGTQSY